MHEPSLRSRPLRTQGGKSYFIEAPLNFDPTTSSRDSSSWSRWRRTNYDFFKRVLALNFPKSRDTVLYDVGAGPTQFQDLFSRFIYVGIDFLPYEDVSIVADLTKELPLADKSCDVIVLSNVLEHIPYPLDLVRECSRMLRPGGMMVGTTPFLMQVHQAPFDFNRYTKFQLERLLSDAGFTRTEVEPLGNLIDTYDTVEVKFFAHVPSGPLRKVLRTLRRIDMACVRYAYGQLPATYKFTEGYGFQCIKDA